MALPEDDKSIPDDEFLFFRVYPAADALVQIADGFRPNSGSFKFAEAMSFDRASMCHPEETRDRAAVGIVFHVARIRVGDLRAAGCVITRDPVPDNPAHVLVWGSNKEGTGSFTKGQRDKAAAASRVILIAPSNGVTH